MSWRVKITGQVEIAPCANLADPMKRWTTVIMGPTGAGKSTFIEALAGAGQSLGISKDQLAGFTQNVSCYRMKNAVVKGTYGTTYPIYLIDTPGFSDSKISELEIINKVKSWMNDQGIDMIDNILYLSPITITRVPGSKRRTIKMLQALLRDNSASSVTIVTTMWDQVSNTQGQKRAEAHFMQLRDDIWKDLVVEGAQLVSFRNDHTSAFGVVKGAIESIRGSHSLGNQSISIEHPSAPLLYQELLERISNSRQQINSLRVDYLELIASPDPLLELWVVPRLLELKQDVAKFLGQLVEFGYPPPAFEGVPEQVILQDLLDHINEDKEDMQALETVLAHRGVNFCPERETILRAQLEEAEKRLTEDSTKLIEYQPDPRFLVPPPPPQAQQFSVSDTPEGSVNSQASLGRWFKKHVKSLKNKITSPFRLAPSH